MNTISPKIFKELYRPRASSHKGENGRLLIIAGSKKYHGSLLFAIKAASRIVDLIYVLTTVENQRLIKKLKTKTAEFIPVINLKSALPKVDCVLIGMGMRIDKKTVQLTKKILLSNKPAVLDAGSLKILYPFKHLLNKNRLLTPHAHEFFDTFKLKPTANNVQKMAAKYNCTIILKGKTDIIGSSNKPPAYNKTGNVGMTKGGTGDVLAGLAAAFFCNNDAYSSACAAAFINGAAGDALFKKVGKFYDAEDLIEQLPLTLHKYIK